MPEVLGIMPRNLFLLGLWLTVRWLIRVWST
jgi:hypothetical protein